MCRGPASCRVSRSCAVSGLAGMAWRWRWRRRRGGWPGMGRMRCPRTEPGPAAAGVVASVALPAAGTGSHSPRTLQPASRRSRTGRNWMLSPLPLAGVGAACCDTGPALEFGRVVDQGPVPALSRAGRARLHPLPAGCPPGLAHQAQPAGHTPSRVDGPVSVAVSGSEGARSPSRSPCRCGSGPPHPAHPRHRAITAANLAGFSLRDDRLFVEVEADTPGAWILTSRTVNRAAQVADAES
jgi:hypothetical protein